MKTATVPETATCTFTMRPQRTQTAPQHDVNASKRPFKRTRTQHMSRHDSACNAVHASSVNLTANHRLSGAQVQQTSKRQRPNTAGTPNSARGRR
eukprot:12823495-Alexandrium_andersonii.AAC.1